MTRKTIYRFFSVILLIAVLFTAVGCDNSKSKANTVTNNIILKDEGDKRLELFKDGLFNYNVIIPENFSDDNTDMLRSTFVTKVRSLTKRRMNLVKENVPIDNNMKNIYIGATSSQLSNDAMTEIEKNGNGYYDYIIMAKNGNIIINSPSSEGLVAAIEYFVNDVIVDLNSTIGDKYYYYYTVEENSNLSINKVPISEFVINCDKYPQGMTYRGCEELKTAIKEKFKCDIPIICGYTENYKNRIIVTEEGEDRNEFEIKVTKDGNMTVKGGHGYSINAALHQLSKNFLAYKEKMSLNIPVGTVIKGKYDGDTLNSDGYRFVWGDDFDDPKLTGWTAESGWEDWGYKMVSDTVSWEDGSLKISAYPTTLSDGTPAYTAGEAVYYDMSFSYGYFEIRAKLPRGNGNWPAFWMKETINRKPINERYSVEIDVFESFGLDGVVTANFHSWWDTSLNLYGFVYPDSALDGDIGHVQHISTGGSDLSGGNRYVMPCVAEGKSVADDWHTYGCEWTPKFIKFYVDGYCYYTHSLESDLTDPTDGHKLSEYMLYTSGTEVNFYLTNSVGSNFGTIKIDETTELPPKFLIDYVHLYQIDDIGIINKK